MSINKEELENKLKLAVNNLFSNQKNIYDFTSETGQTEWNLAHHLANEVQLLLPNYDCDLDVIKINFKNRRPDIILHERKTNQRNFLVIEVKRNGNRQQINDDIRKIKEYWFKPLLQYHFGAVINLNPDKSWQIEIFENQAPKEDHDS